MKKFIALFCVLCCLLLCLSSCKEQNNLFNYVSELRSDVFVGESQNFSLKASYGFKETPFNNDGKVKSRIYVLNFILLDKQTDPATYTLNFSFNQKDWTKEFTLNPVSHVLSAQVEVENFNQKSFDVVVCCESLSETVTLTSILPQNTISYSTALDCIYKHQKDLIDSYYSPDGTFNAEIYLRVLVKDQKPYYYVGFASGNENLKAFLLDGFSGEVLAIRQIF